MDKRSKVKSPHFSVTTYLELQLRELRENVGDSVGGDLGSEGITSLLGPDAAT